jgi:probable rRNA maturation factor
MEPPSSHSIVIVNESGRRAPRALIARAVSSALDLHDRRGAVVVVLLTTDEAVQALNRKFRKVDETTDVLTFPGGEFQGAPLGDIAIAVSYAARQAKMRGVGTDQEIAYLAIHGALHLLGFDDETEKDRKAMVAQMNRAARAAGLKPDENWSSLLHHAGASQ